MSKSECNQLSRMGLFFNRKDRPTQASYVDLHNNAVIRYRRACRTFIWAGIANFVGVLIGAIQHYTIAAQAEQPIPYWLCFGTGEFLYTIFEVTGIYDKYLPLYWVLVGLIALGLTVGATLLGLFSSQGKKKILYAMVISYGVDWIFTFLKSFIFYERDGIVGLLVSVGVHVIVSFFLIMAAYQFYNVINIEKRFKDIPTVAEVKAKEEQEKLESEENDDEHKS